jgi:hypothetical protein
MKMDINPHFISRYQLPLSIPLNAPSKRLHKSNLNGWKRTKHTSSPQQSMTGISQSLLTTPTRPGPMPTYQDTKTSSSMTLWPTVTPVRPFFILCGHYRHTLNARTCYFSLTMSTPQQHLYLHIRNLHTSCTATDIYRINTFSRCSGSIQRLHGTNTLCQGDSSSLQTCKLRSHRLGKRQRYPHGGTSFSCEVPIHLLLQGHVNFVRPILNSYCESNQGDLHQFHLASASHIHKMHQDNPPTDSSGVAFKDSKDFWTN